MYTITKYKNRKMYDAEQGKYINLTDIVQMIKAGRNIRVINHDGNDVTTTVLTEAIVKFSRFTNAENLTIFIRGF